MLGSYGGAFEGSTEHGPLGTFIFNGVIGKGLVNAIRVQVEKQAIDIEASNTTTGIEASGQVVQRIDWDPFDLDDALVAVDGHIAPFKKMLEDLAGGQNPIFNISARKKDTRFKFTDIHKTILGRVEAVNEQTWVHLMNCVLRSFETRITASIRVAAKALTNNGEVELEREGGDEFHALSDEAGSALVGLMDLNWLAAKIDQKISKHAFFVDTQGSAQVDTSRKSWLKPHWVRFSAVVADVDSICKEFLSLTECALINTVPRLRQLHPDKHWATAEIKTLMGFEKRLEKFATSLGIQFPPAILDPLASLVASLRPVFAHSQKKCYGAIKVVVDLYAEGKTLGNMDDVIQRIPEPAEENKAFFNFTVEFLQVVHGGR